jgi:hypothetical protein
LVVAGCSVDRLDLVAEGELLATTSNGVLRLMNGGGETTTRPFADVQTIKVKRSC